MAAFSYLALDGKGKKIKGLLEGDSEKHVRAQLKARQLKPLEVSATAQKKSASGQRGSNKFSLFGPRLNHRDVSLVTRQLASLVQSGLPLDEVLQATAKQSRKQNIKAIILQVRSRVLEGLSLAQAMSEVPRVFDNLYRAMIRAGESSGYLGPVLDQLADYTERSQETRQKMQAAMVYPIVIVVVCVAVVALLMVKVVPQLVGMFERNKQDLPALTKSLISLSDFLVHYGASLLVGIIAFVIGLRWLLNQKANREKWHKLKLRLPLIGSLHLQAESSRYASTLGLLVASGVPLLEALRIASRVLSNLVLQKASQEVANAVQEGSSLAKALDQVDVFPPLLTQMVASGEANGRLAEQLEHVARNQEKELSFSLNTTLGLLQPLMVLLMACIVGLIMMAILQPIFQMNQLVG